MEPVGTGCCGQMNAAVEKAAGYLRCIGHRVEFRLNSTDSIWYGRCSGCGIDFEVQVTLTHVRLYNLWYGESSIETNPYPTNKKLILGYFNELDFQSLSSLSSLGIVKRQPVCRKIACLL